MTSTSIMPSSQALYTRLKQQGYLALVEILPLIAGAQLVGDSTTQVRDLVHPRLVRHPQDMALILEQAAAMAIPQLPCYTIVAPKALAQALGWTADQQNIALPGQLKAVLLVERPRYALATLLSIFDQPVHAESGIHPSAVVDPTATIDPTARIGALAFVGAHAKVGANTTIMPQVTIGAKAQIGEDCLFHPGSRIGERVVIGNRVILQHNASIGADGFSYATPELGSIEAARASATGGEKIEAQNTEIVRINSIGTVILEDDVEVGACATIDRATLGVTLIKKGTKIDNLVMIGHNNTVGENCLVAGQSGIAGSCTIGDRVVMAGQVGIADHTKIGDDTILMAQSGVSKDIAAQQVMMGTPAVPWRVAGQHYAGLNSIRETMREVRRLRKELDALKQQAGI